MPKRRPGSANTLTFLLLSGGQIGFYDSVILTELATAAHRSKVHAKPRSFCKHLPSEGSIHLVIVKFAFVVSGGGVTRRRRPSKPRQLQKTPEFADFTTIPATSRRPVLELVSETLG